MPHNFIDQIKLDKNKTIKQKFFSLSLLIFLSLIQFAHADKKTNRIVVGKIAVFECSDNCYLTLIDKKGKEHLALCEDRNICEKLVASNDENLNGYKGKKVKVTVSQGKQFDNAGNVMGTMDAFVKIEFVK